MNRPTQSVRISHQQFLTEQGATGSGLASIPRITSKPFVGEPDNFSARPAVAMQGLDPKFASELIARLRDACADAPGAESAAILSVEFKIAASGMLYDVRVVRSSGSPEFDAFIQRILRETFVPNVGNGLLDRPLSLRFRVSGNDT